MTVEGFSHTLGTAGQGEATAWGLVEIAPLAVRRRFPLAVWLTILALVAAQAAVTGTNEGFGVFFALLVGAYTVGGYTPRRTAVASLLLLVPVVAYTNWRSTGNLFDDTTFIVALVSGFWVAGRVVWSRNQLVLPARGAVRGPAPRPGRGSTGPGRRAARADRPRRPRRRRAQRLADGGAGRGGGGAAAGGRTLRGVPAGHPAGGALDPDRAARAALRAGRGLRRPPPRTRPIRPALRARGCATRTCWSASWPPRASPSTSPWRGSAVSCPAGVDLAAYRILQEALTNALRHAGAATVTARVVAGPDEVVVDVVDFGGGPRMNGHDLHGGRGPAGHARAGPALRRRGPRPVPRTRASGCTPGSRCRRSRRCRDDDPGGGRRRPGAGARRVRRGAPHAAGPRGRRRSGGRAGGGRRGTSAPPRRGAHGRPDAAGRRHRRHPRDLPGSALRDPGAGPDDVRPRRVRPRRAAGRGQRLPAQGRATPDAVRRRADGRGG